MRLLRQIALCATALVSISGSGAVARTVPPPAHRPPNIVVILVDDLGFSDLGAFGGEIRTPNLDAIAKRGVRFSNFHVTPVCSPTRAELLTGVDHHQTGIGNFPELLQDNQVGKPGYEGFLTNRVATIAERLHDAGYKTLQSGKWHLGYDPSANPAARGFERSFTLVGGGHNHFGADRNSKGPAIPNAGLRYTLDGKTLQIPDNFYSSDYFTDQFLNFLPDASDKRPFFGYLAFTAPHYPLQAPEQDIRRYSGKYDGGYDQLREQRIARLKALGLVPSSIEAHAPTSDARWDGLPPEQKRIEARKMEVYAAMVDRVDQNVGRLVAALKKRGDYDNTVILFLSDNGAEGHELDKSFVFPEVGKYLLSTGDNRLDQIGSAKSYVWYGQNWAEAASGPFRKSKSFPTEGGTRVAAFISYPAKVKAGIDPALTSVRDVVPTLLDFADVHPDPAFYKDHVVIPPQGKSFANRLEHGATAADRAPRFMAGEMFGRRYVREGKWKAVHIPPPTGTGQWELFDMDQDPGEVHNLAREQPDILAKLVRAWNVYASDKGVVLPVIPGN